MSQASPSPLIDSKYSIKKFFNSVTPNPNSITLSDSPEQTNISDAPTVSPHCKESSTSMGLENPSHHTRKIRPPTKFTSKSILNLTHNESNLSEVEQKGYSIGYSAELRREQTICTLNKNELHVDNVQGNVKKNDTVQSDELKSRCSVLATPIIGLASPQAMEEISDVENEVSIRDVEQSPEENSHSRMLVEFADEDESVPSLNLKDISIGNFSNDQTSSKSRKRKATQRFSPNENTEDPNTPINKPPRKRSASKKEEGAKSRKQKQQEVSPEIERQTILEALDADSRKLHDLHQRRLEELSAELSALERSEDFQSHLGIQEAARKLLEEITDGKESSEEVETVAVDSDPTSNGGNSSALIASLIARCLEGSPLTLSEFVSKISPALTTLITNKNIDSFNPDYFHSPSGGHIGKDESPKTEPESATQTQTSPSVSMDVEDNSTNQGILKPLSKYLDNIEMRELVKKLADRKPLGARDSRSCSVFESRTAAAVYRWHVIDPTKYFSEDAVQGIKEARSVRGKYGKAIRASVALMDTLLKKDMTVQSKEKVEEDAAKCLKDVEAWKCKRNETIRQKQRKDEERVRKEEEKERKRLQREEELRQKEEAKKEREAQMALDKKLAAEAAAAALLEQQNKKKLPSIMNFLKPLPAQPPSSSSLSSNIQSKLNQKLSNLGELISITNKDSGPVINGSTAAAGQGAEIPEKSEFEKEFEKNVMTGQQWTMEDIRASYRKRFASRRCVMSCRQRRAPIKLTVTVVVPSWSGGIDVSDNNNVELREVLLDRRMRFLSFHQDYRPAYWGTFSKKSAEVTGRRPFGKDTSLDYEYDSEAEWEEGEDPDAEDILMSEGGDSEDEDDGEGNELVFDDVFLRDNDFGSDAGSDGGEFAATKISVRNATIVELSGPIFLSSAGTGQVIEDGVVTPCASHIQGDVGILKSFPLVFHTPQLNWPELGSTYLLPDGTVTSGPQPIAQKAEEEVPVKDGEKKAKSSSFPETLVPELLQLVHGKLTAIDKLVEEFWTNHQELPKAQIKRQIQKYSSFSRDPEGFGRRRWVVGNDHLAITELPEVKFTPRKEKKTKLKPSAAGAESLTLVELLSGDKTHKARGVPSEDNAHNPLESVATNDLSGEEGEEGGDSDKKENPLQTTTAPTQSSTLFRFWPSLAKSSPGRKVTHEFSEGVEEHKDGSNHTVLALGDFEVEGVGMTHPLLVE